jgi:hypothetical protein
MVRRYKFVDKYKDDYFDGCGGSSLGGEKTYPAYCFYIPQGFDEDFDVNLLKKLEILGKNMTDTLYVGKWNIGDVSFINLLNRINVQNRPAIILTDCPKPDNNSFMIILDEQNLIKNTEKVTQIIPPLLDFIYRKNYKDAVKEATRASDFSKLSGYFNPIKKITENFKVSFSWLGVKIESK